jgi:hypothetical protein
LHGDCIGHFVGFDDGGRGIDLVDHAEAVGGAGAVGLNVFCCLLVYTGLNTKLFQ